MDTEHYQDKHDSLRVLPKAAQAVTLNHRAACLTRPTDVEQKHTLAFPANVSGFHAAQRRQSKPAPQKPAALPTLSGVPRGKACTPNLPAAVNETPTVLGKFFPD